MPELTALEQIYFEDLIPRILGLIIVTDNRI